jgi:PAS domain S-box-containing protein
MRTHTAEVPIVADRSPRLHKVVPSPARRTNPRRNGKLRWIVGLYLLLIAGILVYNARVTQSERAAALVVNIAGRQQALAERYMKDVLLRTEGFEADPEEDAELLQHTAKALLEGGEVLAVQGADGTVRIRPASGDWRVVAKLRHEQDLIESLIAHGEELLEADRNSPSFPQQLLELRIVGAQVSAISNDAVGQMTVDLDASLRRLRLVGIILGFVGTLAAIVMAVLLRRVAARQAARFGTLVHQSSDLITVIDENGIVRYQSASIEQVLGMPAAEVVGRDLGTLIHPEDRARATALWAELAARPHATGRVEYRICDGNGAWRQVESAVTNLILDPTAGGLVLNTRDITERHDIEEALKKLQTERGQLLDRTVQATEQERKRIAAELHDGPVQRLTALDLKLMWVAGELEGNETGAIEQIGWMQSALREQIQQIRLMMTQLRPPILDERGLEAALRDHLISAGNGVDLDVSVQGALVKRLAPSQETILYRVAQEAMANVLKHAQAEHAWLTLQERNGRVLLEIRDDGVGFDPEGMPEGRIGHFGILGMKERIEMAGGSWLLQSEAGRGTLIRASLPRE